VGCGWQARGVVNSKKLIGASILPLFEITRMLVRLNHVASMMLNGNHKIRLFTLSSRRSPCSEKR
jgi:hypothetical protein